MKTLKRIKEWNGIRRSGLGLGGEEGNVTTHGQRDSRAHQRRSSPTYKFPFYPTPSPAFLISTPLPHPPDHCPPSAQRSEEAPKQKQKQIMSSSFYGMGSKPVLAAKPLPHAPAAVAPAAAPGIEAMFAQIMDTVQKSVSSLPVYFLYSPPSVCCCWHIRDPASPSHSLRNTRTFPRLPKSCGYGARLMTLL